MAETTHTTDAHTTTHAPTPVPAGADSPVNPFDADGPDATFLVLANSAGDHSLWPGFAAVPAGWSVQHGPCPRQEALDWIAS